MFHVVTIWNPDYPAYSIQSTNLFTVVDTHKVILPADADDEHDIILTLRYRSKVPGLTLRTELIPLLDTERLKQCTDARLMAAFFDHAPRDSTIDAVYELVIDTRLANCFDVVKYISIDACAVTSKAPLELGFPSVTPDVAIAQQQKYWRFYQKFAAIDVDLQCIDTGSEYKLRLGRGGLIKIDAPCIEGKQAVFKVEQMINANCRLLSYTDEFTIPNTIEDIRLDVTIIDCKPKS